MKDLWDRFIFWLSIKFGMTGRGLSIFFVSLLVLMLAAVMLPSSCSALNLDLTYSAAFVPPHNEPVIGNKVARYRATVGADLHNDRLRVQPELLVWGVNTWQSGGSQKSSSWFDDDWSIEDVRPAFNLELDFGPENLHLYSEYYTPIGDWSRKGAGSFESYWWLVGVRGRLNLF